MNRYIVRSFAVGLLLAAPFAMAEGQTPPSNSNAVAALLSRLDTLQRQVRDLTGQLESQQHEMSQMKAQQRDRYVDLDKRISMLMAASAPKSSVPASAPNATDNEPTSIETNKPNTSADSSDDTASKVKLAPIALKPVTPEAKQAYNNAYKLIRERQFETAEVSFTEFVKDFPDNQLTGNGYYWLGELKLVLGKPKEAIEQFNTVIKKFPGHNKEPDALYKLGIVNDQIGDTDKSKSYLQEVIKRFPNSKAAKLATSYLSKLK